MDFFACLFHAAPFAVCGSLATLWFDCRQLEVQSVVGSYLGGIALALAVTMSRAPRPVRIAIESDVDLACGVSGAATGVLLAVRTIFMHYRF